ncbi:hypothetical protein CEXT_724681 [Caerostris extrusa]|uniref:Uncharacterized protein n=1 Tax=Caerostris extrusa TaxID=172846 RepID=A0AAV4QQY2_CAEEX|nr:hypothetical protein CEXT_724681 [Caerostris extrusa]
MILLVVFVSELLQCSYHVKYLRTFKSHGKSECHQGDGQSCCCQKEKQAVCWKSNEAVVNEVHTKRCEKEFQEQFHGGRYFSVLL